MIGLKNERSFLPKSVVKYDTTEKYVFGNFIIFSAPMTVFFKLYTD